MVWSGSNTIRTWTDLAVVMLIGDKTTLGSRWYPAQVQLIESKARA